MQTCLSDVKTWMTQNKLKLNDDKTEALLIKSNRTTFPNAQPTCLRVGSAGVLFKTCARNLDFMMSLDKHISNVCRSAYMEIRRHSSIRQYLTAEATKTLVCACLLSNLDYCNSLLSGCPLYSLKRLKKCSEICSETAFQITQTPSCATSSSSSSLATGSSQSRLQIVNYLSQLLLRLIPCLPL